jgi:hypothetical protein
MVGSSSVAQKIGKSLSNQSITMTRHSMRDCDPVHAHSLSHSQNVPYFHVEIHVTISTRQQACKVQKRLRDVIRGRCDGSGSTESLELP